MLDLSQAEQTINLQVAMVAISGMMRRAVLKSTGQKDIFVFVPHLKTQKV